MQHLLTCCAYAAVVLHWVHQDAAAGGGAAPGSRAPDAAAGALRVYRPWWGFQNRMSRILSPSRASGVPPICWPTACMVELGWMAFRRRAHPQIFCRARPQVGERKLCITVDVEWSRGS